MFVSKSVMYIREVVPAVAAKGVICLCVFTRFRLEFNY